MRQTMMIRNPPRSLPPRGSIAVASALPSPVRRDVRKSGISRCNIGLEGRLSRSIALGRSGTPGLGTAFSRSRQKIFLDCVAHQARLMRRFTFRLDTETRFLLFGASQNILHFAHPAIAANSRAAGPAKPI